MAFTDEVVGGRTANIEDLGDILNAIGLDGRRMSLVGRNSHVCVSPFIWVEIVMCYELCNNDCK